MGLAGLRLVDPPDFRAWLLAKHGSLARINAALKTKLTALDKIESSATELPANRLLRPSWLAFALETVPLERWQIAHPARHYLAFLRHRYGAVSDAARPPQGAFDRQEFLAYKGELKRYSLTDNFRQVFHYIAGQGPAL